MNLPSRVEDDGARVQITSYFERMFADRSGRFLAKVRPEDQEATRGMLDELARKEAGSLVSFWRISQQSHSLSSLGQSATTALLDPLADGTVRARLDEQHPPTRLKGNPGFGNGPSRS